LNSAYGRLPLNALRVFEAVATRLSFAEAADALGVTPAAVSQQIKSLEDFLQVPLLRRGGRNVELTPEGAMLLPGIRQGLDVLVVSLRQLRQSRASGNLQVSTLSSLLQKWVTPRLQRLNETHPGIQVDWHTSRDPVDFSRSDFHAAVRFGPGGYPGLFSQKLMDEWLVVVCTPAVLARHGSLDGRTDLHGLPLLHAKDEPWSRWMPSPTEAAWTANPATIDDSVSILLAAAEGLGYAVVRWSLAAQDIERGTLVLASGHVVPSRWSYWFVCPEAYAGMPKVEALRGWLVAEAAAFGKPPDAPPARGKRKAVSAARGRRGR
jgi:LysR family glycine cleavage system transcriptional activator